jgi:hypothetical protein
MARNRVPAEPDREELPLTPMIDVIFQYAVSALDACRRAGVTQVDFAASPRIHETLRDD